MSDKEIMPESEAQLASWASERGYLIRDRIWGTDLLDETQAEIQLGKYDKPGLSEKSKKLLSNADLFEGIAFRRDIFVPNGLIRYDFIRLDEMPFGSDEELAEFLKSGEEHCSYVDGYFGKRIDNWKSDRATSGLRINSARQSGEEWSARINSKGYEFCLEKRLPNNDLQEITMDGQIDSPAQQLEAVLEIYETLAGKA